MNTNVTFSSEREDWTTPQNLFDELNAEFNFTLDAAASPENAKCERFFTEEQNALCQNWGVKPCSAILPTAGKPEIS